VTLVADGVEMPANRALLAARSWYFRALFFSGLKESKQNIAEFPCLSAVTLRFVLHFVVSDDYPELARGAMDSFNLLVAAEMFMMDALKKLALEACINSIRPENVLEVLMGARKHKLQELQEYCLTYSAKHSKQLGKDSIATMVNDCPLVIDLLMRVISGA
jgi:hypothetical protein